MASNVDEVATTKRPRNAKQPNPSNDDRVIEEDPVDQQGAWEGKSEVRGSEEEKRVKEQRRRL